MASIDVDNETIHDFSGSCPALLDIGGWCSGCGRRRGRDGRCPNCDPWWSNALIQVGGPLILGTLLLLFLGIRMLEPNHSLANDNDMPAAFSVAPQTAWAASRSVAALAAAPSSPAPMPARYSASFSMSLPPSPEAVQQAQIEHLRHLSRQTDAALMQQQPSQTQPMRTHRPALAAIRAVAEDAAFLPVEEQLGSF